MNKTMLCHVRVATATSRLAEALDCILDRLGTPLSWADHPSSVLVVVNGTVKVDHGKVQEERTGKVRRWEL